MKRKGGESLAKHARGVCYYREDRFFLADPETSLHKGDEVVILTQSDNLPALRERWKPKLVNDRLPQPDGDESPGRKENSNPENRRKKK